MKQLKQCGINICSKQDTAHTAISIKSLSSSFRHVISPVIVLSPVIICFTCSFTLWKGLRFDVALTTESSSVRSTGLAPGWGCFTAGSSSIMRIRRITPLSCHSYTSMTSTALSFFNHTSLSQAFLNQRHHIWQNETEFSKDNSADCYNGKFLQARYKVW